MREGSKGIGDLAARALRFALWRAYASWAHPLADRLAARCGFACVDAVVVCDEPTPAELIRELEPDVLAKGGDYTPDQIAGADLVLSRGGRVVTIPLVPGLSTTAILERRGSGS